jgi:DNA polymerase
MGKLREEIQEYGDQKISLFAIYHPAYLLRSPTQKAKAYEDLLRVKKILEQHE